ncbi:MAG: tol-pal system-associated acyl-CoA thioesterase [Rhodobacteraceae bacterium]|nr:tol-pal system-associated acyl-CoA thioesterase [Paracoccaceae bacterium]
MPYTLPIRVYYEDTDMAGIVYYANYLKFIERGRSEWVREIGMDQHDMKAEGIVFAVRRVECDYLGSAVLDDLLTVETEVANVTAARLVMEQRVKRGEEVLFHAMVTVVCMNEAGQPVRLPANIRQMVH